MDHSYFRQEAMEAQQARFQGAIVMRQPVPMRVAAYVSIAIGTLLACYVCLAQYTRKVHVSGKISPAAGAIQAVAVQGGRIVRVHALNGARIREGQPLFDLSAERSSGGGTIDARIDASLGERRRSIERELDIQTAQLRERTSNLQSRARLKVDDIDRLADEIMQQRKRWERAQDLLQRYRELRNMGYVAEQQLVMAENEVSDQLAQLRALERAQRSTKGDLLQAQDELAQMAAQGALYRAQAARSLASLDQEQAEQQGRVGNQVVAPASGVLTAIAVEAGQTVAAGTALATVLPAGSQLQARLAVPSRAIGFIDPGQAVLLRVAAFPYQKFGFLKGVVRQVDHAPLPVLGTANSEPVYLVIVDLQRQSLRAYGMERALQAGMDVDGDVQLDRRTLLEWIFDPLLSVSGGTAARQ